MAARRLVGIPYVVARSRAGRRRRSCISAARRPRAGRNRGGQAARYQLGQPIPAPHPGRLRGSCWHLPVTLPVFANAITRVPHVVAGNVTTLLSPSLINRVLGQVLATWLPTTWPRPNIRVTRCKVVVEC